mgnify:CR=1 FL=1
MDVLSVYPFLQKFALKLTKNTEAANDLCHDTVVKILEKRDLFDGENLQAWAGRVMFTLFVDQHRRNKKFSSYYDPESYLRKLKTGPEQEDIVYLRQVIAQIDALPDHMSSALLDFIIGNSCDEVADNLNIAQGTARSRIHRARARLAE